MLSDPRTKHACTDDDKPARRYSKDAKSKALCNGLWFQLLSVKYLKRLSLHCWLRKKSFSLRRVSVIWKGFPLTIPWLGKGLIWKVGNGSSIRLGVDPIVGLGSFFLLPLNLLDYLADYGICSLEHARNQTLHAQNYWFLADDLELRGEWKILWDNYIRGLEFGRIRLSDNSDSLLWTHNIVTVAMGYDCIVSSFCSEEQTSVLDTIWKFNIPLKIGCFIWLLGRGLILTWDQLQHRGLQGPSRCVLCCLGEEIVQHLFLDCPFTIGILTYFAA